MHGNHPIARLVDDTFQALRGLVAAADWTEVITAYLLNECAAIPMREDGRIWWVGPSAAQRLDDLTLFLDEIGLALVKCDIEPAAKSVVQETVQDSLASRLKELQDEVALFDGTQRPATYKDRLATYAQLKKRCQTYQSVLGVGIADAEEALVALEAKVCDLLLVRQSTTIHKDGTVTVADLNPEVPSFEAPEAVVF